MIYHFSDANFNPVYTMAFTGSQNANHNLLINVELKGKDVALFCAGNNIV
jgi:hypothetical protein